MSQTSAQLVGSVLFTDLVGFTDFNDVRGDDAAVQVLDQQHALIEAALATQPGSPPPPDP